MCIYVDNVIIFAKDFDEHNEKLIEAFERFREHNLKLQPTLHKSPKNVKRIESFLGLANYY